MKRELFWGLDAKRVAIALFLILVIGLVGRWGLGHLFTSGEANSAKERVRRVLDGMKPGGDLEKAIALWYSGSMYVPGGPDIFAIAADSFSAWREERGLAASISSYEIASSEVTEETGRLGEATVVVSGTIEGEPFRMRVVQGESIAWMD